MDFLYKLKSFIDHQWIFIKFTVSHVAVERDLALCILFVFYFVTCITIIEY